MASAFDPADLESAGDVAERPGPGAGGEAGDGVDGSRVAVEELPEGFAALSDALLALRGPEAVAYRLLAGEYLLLAVELEKTLDVVLSMWFIEMDRNLFREFDGFLERMGLDKKLSAIRRLVTPGSSGAGALLARADRVQRLRNRIAHSAPRIDDGVVRFPDEVLTPAQFEADITSARDLPLDLLDGLFPLVVERRRRWGARDILELDFESDDPAEDDESAESEPTNRRATRSRRRRGGPGRRGGPSQRST